MSVGEEKSGALGDGSVGRRRRLWSEAQKRQIVAETHEPGVSVPMGAQRYNSTPIRYSGGGVCFASLSTQAGWPVSEHVERVHHSGATASPV